MPPPPYSPGSFEADKWLAQGALEAQSVVAVDEFAVDFPFQFLPPLVKRVGLEHPEDAHVDSAIGEDDDPVELTHGGIEGIGMENDFRFAPGTPVVRLHQGDAAVAVAGAGQGDMAVAFSVMIGEEAGVGRAGMPARGVIDLPVVAVGGPGQARGALAVLVDGEDRQLEAAFGRAFIEEDRAGGGQALPVEDLVGTHTRRQGNGCGQVRALPVDTVLAFGGQKPLVLGDRQPPASSRGPGKTCATVCDVRRRARLDS